MAYFPMFVDLTDKKCVVVGGGHVAARKIAVLVEFGVKVRVVAPRIGEGTAAVICGGADIDGQRLVNWEQRRFDEADLDEADLVIAATDDRELNHRIAAMAKTRGLQVNSATDKKDCTFVFPAVIRRGETVIGISSSGSSPALTAQLKKKIEAGIPADLQEKAEYLEAVRAEVKEKVESPEQRQAMMREITARIFDGDHSRDVS